MVNTASNNDYTMNISNWVRKSSIAEMVAKLWRHVVMRSDTIPNRRLCIEKRTSEFFNASQLVNENRSKHFLRYDIFILFILRFTLWSTKRTILLHSVNIKYVRNKLRFSDAKKSLIYLGPLLWRYLYNMIRDWCFLLCCSVSMF